MIIELVAVNGVLFICLIYMIFRRMTLVRSMTRQVDSATGQLKGKVGEKIQTLTFAEQQNLQLSMRRTDLSRMEKRILNLEKEIRNMEIFDYRIVHSLSEPSRDHPTFTCALSPNPFADRAQKLSEPLEHLEHYAIISAESDDAAKRMIQVHFPDRGAFRASKVEMARKSGA